MRRRLRLGSTRRLSRRLLLPGKLLLEHLLLRADLILAGPHNAPTDYDNDCGEQDRHDEPGLQPQRRVVTPSYRGCRRIRVVSTGLAAPGRPGHVAPIVRGRFCSNPNIVRGRRVRAFPGLSR